MSKITLYPEQERDVEAVISAYLDREQDRYKCPYRYIVNFSDAGVGKTIETVECIKRLGYSSEGQGVLVLCPKSLMSQWRGYLPSAEIRSYEWWRIHGEDIEYDCVVLDEFHKLKNRNAQISNRVWGLRRKHPDTLFFGLTATPMRNQPTDMWGVLHVIGVFGGHPEYNGWGKVRESYWAFCDRYYVMKTDGFKEVFSGYKQATFDELMFLINSRVSPVRRELELDVPIRRVLVECTMDKEQLELYRNVKKLIYESLPADISIQNGLVRLLRLLQITACPKCITQNSDVGYGCKFEMVYALLNGDGDLRGKNVVIFSRFRTVLAHLREYLGVVREVYDGSVSARGRSALLADFKEHGGVLLATIGAAGTGLDGLQHTACDMIFIDRDWSPNINYQAEARLYRTGQTHEVTVYEMQVQRSIDQYVDRLLTKKSQDFRQLMIELLTDSGVDD